MLSSGGRSQPQSALVPSFEQILTVVLQENELTRELKLNIVEQLQVEGERRVVDELL